MTSVAVIIGVLAAIGLMVWPRVGLCARWSRFRALAWKQNLEDTLKHLHHCEFLGQQATLESLSGAVGVSRDHVVRIISDLEQAGLAEVWGGRPSLTAAGRREALRIIRIHRLWEKFLAERSGLDEVLWHDEADRREHVTSSDQAEALDASLGYPRFDPHGAPIPTAAGELPQRRGVLLSTVQPGQVGRVVHVEDEPLALHQQLEVQGLAVGAVVRVIAASSLSLRIEVGGEEQVVAQVAAANVSVDPIELPADVASRGVRLSRMGLHRKARVLGLLPTCRGLQRRRLLDLGLLTGTVVEPELRSGWGNVVGYRIRGALIALRQDQASQIQVEPVESE
ncbi:MAG: metal-dependent transcriptional regulator [Patescibacteria group bacterium]|nr:metal-dependent transcriptional regulator [Patescibacteria group bacterium]